MTMTLFSWTAIRRLLRFLDVYRDMASTFNPLGSYSSTEPTLHKTKIAATQKVKVIKTKLGLYLLFLPLL